MKLKTREAGHREPAQTCEGSPAQPMLLSHRVRQIAFGITLVAAGLGPLAPTYEGSPVLRLLVQMFFILAGALWVISMALEGRVRIRSTGLEIGLLLLAGGLVSGTVNAHYKYPAILTLFSWLSALTAFIFLVNETRSRRRRLMVLLILGAAALIISLHGLHQITVDLPRARALFEQETAVVLRELRLPPEAAFDMTGRLEKDRIFGTFLLPNSLACFLALLAPALIGLLMDSWKNRPSPFAPKTPEVSAATPRQPMERFSIVGLVFRAGLVLPLLLALFFTKSKGGWTAFLAAALVFALWAFGALLLRRRLQILGLCAALLIVWGIAQASGHLPPLRDYLGSSTVRYGYWRAAAVTFAEHPLVGVGLDNFSDFYAQKKLPEDQEARRAHNDYLQLAAETGLIGIGTYAVFLALFWRRVLRMRGEPVLAHPEPSRLDAAGTAGLLAASACILGLEALCSGSLRMSPGFWGWEWLGALWLAWLAFVLLNTGNQDPFALGRHSFATLGIACGVIAFLVHSLADLNHYIGGTLQTAWILMALLLSARLSEERESYAVDRALGPLPRLGLVLGAAAVALLTLYGFVAPLAEAHILHERALEPHRPTADCLLDLEAAVGQFPLDAENHELLSDFYLAEWLQGRPRTAQDVSTISQSISAIRKAIELDPMRSEYYTRLGRLYEIQWRQPERSAWRAADYREAMDAYAKAEELFPSNPDAALSRGRMYDQAGNYESALHHYLSARNLSDKQYHLPRKYDAAELAELNARIKDLQKAATGTATPPASAFRQPRLLGWPRGFAPPAAQRGQPPAFP